LPDGVFVRHGDTTGLLSAGRLLPWSFTGYLAPQRVSARSRVELLTPPAVVGALAAGYRPLVHPSAGPTSMRMVSDG
jgi:hypothetical protein